ncbi:hypothetical protein VW35_03975, partial [Devosia soli]
AGSGRSPARAALAEGTAAGGGPVAATNAAALGGRGVIGTLDGVELFLGSPRAAAERASLSDEFEARIGQLNDECKTVSVLVAGRELAGLIAMRDEPRDDPRAGLAAPKALGPVVVTLTGAHARNARPIGAAIGLAVGAELPPESKHAQF